MMLTASHSSSLARSVLRHALALLMLLALLALAGCIAAPGDGEAVAQTYSQPYPASNYGQAQPITQAAPAPKGDDAFAPATRILRERPEEVVQAAGGEAFAPPTRVGEMTLAPTIKVGLLVPMSGNAGKLGQSLLDAATMAIFDKYSSMSAQEITMRIELLPQDTGDTIEGAEKAAQEAIEQGAQMILGPVFGKQVAAVASIAKHRNIPVVTFSNNISVAGGGVYLFGFIPEQQVIRVVQYALERKYVNISALVPSNPYGATIVKQLSTEVRKSGGRAHPIEYYQEDMSALDNNIGRLARFLQEQEGQQKALFIAEGGAKLRTLTESLTANGISSAKVQLLGTGLWDDTDIAKIQALHGGWFASSPPERYRQFEQHFNNTFRYKPDRLASLSYDAVALAATLALTEVDGKRFTTAAITDPIGFNGPANGIFRFRQDGVIERGLAILSITPGGFQTVAPAPRLFNQ